jgi:hypothetical protein
MTSYNGIIIRVFRGNACLGRQLPQIQNTEEKRLDTGESYRVVEAQAENKTEEKRIGNRPAQRIHTRSI